VLLDQQWLTQRYRILELLELNRVFALHLNESVLVLQIVVFLFLLEHLRPDDIHFVHLLECLLLGNLLDFFLAVAQLMVVDDFVPEGLL
jgi:hypothetical protein